MRMRNAARLSTTFTMRRHFEGGVSHLKRSKMVQFQLGRSSESASQEEQNATSFSSVAPSSECAKNLIKMPYYIVQGFWAETENFDFGKT